MKRFRIVNILLLALIALAGWRTYEVWRRQAPAAMPSGDEAATVVEPLAPAPRNPPVTQLVTVIAEKDLFDPSRQAGGVDSAPMPEQTPAPPPTLKLAGVIVLDGQKEAVFADASQGNKQKRMRIGEEISGYRVQSIDEQNVSLVNGAGEEVRLTLLLEAGKMPSNAFGPGGRPTPRPAPVRATARSAAQRAQVGVEATNPQAFGPKAYDPNANATAAEDRERQREEARERAQRARERLKRLRQEAARR
jgi:hypothetical protein